MTVAVFSILFAWAIWMQMRQNQQSTKIRALEAQFREDRFIFALEPLVEPKIKDLDAPMPRPAMEVLEVSSPKALERARIIGLARANENRQIKTTHASEAALAWVPGTVFRCIQHDCIYYLGPTNHPHQLYDGKRARLDGTTTEEPFYEWKESVELLAHPHEILGRKPLT